ncbi:MAG: Holliday junction resolvase RuvX [Firmicutes bacterium]|nr:Holliday junction resolvase RuvX [Bacillota bacterium]
MRIMALDVGEKRIGVAVSDPLGMTAQGIKVLANDKKTFAEIKKLCQEYEVSRLVIGMPRNMNGTYGPGAESAEQFAEELAITTGLPVDFEDERLTTMAAERVLIDADVSRRKRRKVVDKMAAVIILQSYLQRGEKNV